MTTQTLSPTRAMFAAFLMLTACMVAGLVSPARAQAPQNFENLDRLDSLVAMSVGANRGEPGGPIAPIDRRLRLAPCPQTPVVEAGLANAATVSCPAIGWRIRVPLSASQMPQNPQFSRAYAASPATASAVVKKGDPVQLVAGNEEFSISRLMIADEDGAVGALIRVRQDQKATPVMARVEAIGVVRVPGI
ncbi:MAG: flagella basal body P-ring formation protein FlgA [Sphingomonadales bacterium]|nr:flagella basal body P-ring formation protein FlgA [Sphingomonadales bacterium]